MVKKKVTKKAPAKISKKQNEWLGISGLTLGISGLFVLLFNPLVSLLFFVVGFIFCFKQQRRKKIKAGKIGIIVNVLGFILNILLFVFLILYIIPNLPEMQGSFPQ